MTQLQIQAHQANSTE